MSEEERKRSIEGYNAASFTTEDYKQARDKWRLRLVGDPELNKQKYPSITWKIKKTSEECGRSLRTMNTKGVPVILWGEKAPIESKELPVQYCGILQLAKGWGTYGSDFYQDEEVKQKILFGLEWMYFHMFGEAEITGTGWRDPHAYNWYDWFVGAPTLLGDILLILEDVITLEQREKYYKCFKWIMTYSRNLPLRNHASSRIEVCTKAALLLEDAQMLQKEYEDYERLVGLVEEEEGPRMDYVQWSHKFPYNIGYGNLNFERVLLVGSILSGTPLAFYSEKEYEFFNMAKYMFEPAFYKGQAFMMLNGRKTHDSELNSGAKILACMLPMIGFFGEDEDAYLKQMIKRNASVEGMPDAIIEYCSINDCAILEEILADTSIPFEDGYTCAYAWYTGDRAAQHCGGYAVGISMRSKREITYESINDMNKTGWYTSDGAMYLYTDYDHYQYDGPNFIFNGNIAYRIPGTTEDVRKRAARSVRMGHAWKSGRSFAGGMQLQNRYLLCAMDFDSMHFEGPEEEIEDQGYGGGEAVHLNDLEAKKAWFLFEREIVALGAGIYSSMDAEVNTIVEHRRIVEDDRYCQCMSGKQGTLLLKKESFESHFENPDWILMEGHAGYYFPEGGNVYVGRYDYCTQPYFEVRLEHGKNPQDGSYAYVVIPYANEKYLEEYGQKKNIEILANKSTLQVVRNSECGVTGYVFYKAGTFKNVVVDSPVMLLVSEGEGVFDMTVCDPTHEIEQATIWINMQLFPKTWDNRFTIEQEKSNVKICIDFKGANGKALMASFVR